MIAERPALERRVAESLEASRIPVVLGACGSGRTSLLLRLVQTLGSERSQYLDLAAAATTPERCLAAITSTCRFTTGNGEAAAPPDSPRAAFDALLHFFNDARTASGEPVTFCVDEFLDIRTFESFPGLRHVQKEIIAGWADSPNHFVLASRFTTRTHRLLRDAPARFEVVHVPALDAQEVNALAPAFGGSRPEAARAASPAVAALTDGRAAYVHAVLGSLAQMGSASDPVAALAALYAPDGRLTGLCRASYELRLHRARGYGALKAILGVLADVEPLNLTEISHRLHRTPGSTKDYLSWLEDVDLVTSQRKRYAFEDPLLRLFVRLYGRPVPPTDDDVVREIHTYAQLRLPLNGDVVPVPAEAPSVSAADRDSEIIEID